MHDTSLAFRILLDHLKAAESIASELDQPNLAHLIERAIDEARAAQAQATLATDPP
jgi:hypothetical protein